MLEPKSLRVVGAALLRENRVLLAQRSEKMQLPFYWEFPGGKIEAGESPEEALIREIREELDIEITVGRHLATGHASLKGHPDYDQLSLSVYRAELGDQKPKAKEHAALRWVERQQLNHYAFPEADLPAVIALLLEESSQQNSQKPE